MNSFEELVASRRTWIEEILIPWCKVAPRRDLMLAENEWQDLAGRPSPEQTLWKWAWERFPVLTHSGLNTINETNEVSVVCSDGRKGLGYPDSTKSESGLLFLANAEGQIVGPFAIDEISSIDLVDQESIMSQKS